MSLFEQAKTLAFAEILKEVPDTGMHAAWINTKAHQAHIMSEEAMWNSLNGPKPSHFTTEGAIRIAAEEIMKQYKLLGYMESAPAPAAAPGSVACDTA